MDTVLELDRVSFTYARATQPALHEVSLKIPKGAFVGIIGPAGAGKTTLLRCLNGACPHHFQGEFYGTATVDSLDTCETSLTDIARMVGSIGQDIDAQMVTSTVVDEIVFGLENYGIPYAEGMQRLDTVLKELGIEDLKDREIASLSGGQKQKVAIAALQAIAPRVLILDEPTAALDPVSSESVYAILARLAATKKVTVVVVEQKIATLARFCTRMVLVNKGHIVLDGTPAEIFAKPEILEQVGVHVPRATQLYHALCSEQLCKSTAPFVESDTAVQELLHILKTNRLDTPNHTSQAFSYNKTPPLPKNPPVNACSHPITGDVSKSAPHHEIGIVSASGLDPSAQQPLDTTRKSPEGLDRSLSTFVDAELNTTRKNPEGLDLRGISFSYPHSSQGVQHISLHVDPGEIVALLGQNGAGKSTITKLICGLLTPSTGELHVDGQDLLPLRASERAQWISVLFQNPDHQLCKPTVAEELIFGLTLHGANDQHAIQHAHSLADRFGLPLDEAPFALSRGQRQLLAFASILACKPRVLILDEPTCGLDYRECLEVMNGVCEAAQAGCAVLMVTHDMELVGDYAHRVALMAQGSLLGCGPTHEMFFKADALQKAAVLPPQAVEIAQQLMDAGYPRYKHAEGIDDIAHITKELITNDASN